MADQSRSNVGGSVDIEASPGNSMHGVTGREATFGFSVEGTESAAACGEKFRVAVDSEHKATQFKLFSLLRPFRGPSFLGWLWGLSVIFWVPAKAALFSSCCQPQLFSACRSFPPLGDL
ncbi:hypothetical protein SUGI_0426850 [Cryptomeria japonica]|nr:hypothetical protein SUGI_0426850 [Cryptomeria japonica]